MSWTRADGVYVRIGHRVRGFVAQEDELWASRVYLDGRVVYMAEWSSREDALQNCGGAMSRICFFRRFEENPPMCEADEADEDEDDDED